MDIILHDAMGNSFGSHAQLSEYRPQEKQDVPVGTTVFHRKTSMVRALIYGRYGRSIKVGSRSFPTTASISACAFLTTSGCIVSAKKKEYIADTV